MSSAKKKKPKVKIKNDDIDDTYDYMKTNKDNIKNVIKNKDDLIIINNLAILVNKIVIHALQFLKLYILYLYDNKLNFPKIDKEFICDIFKIITIRKCGSGGYTDDNMPTQMKDLKLFYDEHYKTTIVFDDILYYDKLSYILAYEAIDIEKNITNNIQEHYEQHINKFVNITFKLKDKLKEINERYVKPETRKQKKIYYIVNLEILNMIYYHYQLNINHIKNIINGLKNNKNLLFQIKQNLIKTIFYMT